ncbi:YjbF family lipoprotein [Pelagibacterium sp.]|uniref:YjbF family lipoprotein n=1 Tax=Pelagibacterium sp. TaxID=1967288 RepID=UPI003A8E0AA0
MRSALFLSSLLRPLTMGGLALVMLAGCATGPETASLEVQIGTVVRDEVRRRINKSKAPQPPVLTRALLDTIQEPHVEVVIEEVDLRDYLTLQVRRQDDQPGQIEVWRTVDNITFSFRDGMLISTRGLRGTLLSAEVPADGEGGMGPARGGGRLYEVRAGDSDSWSIRLACDLEDLGEEQLEIVEQTYTTRHLREQCIGEMGGRIVNDYWIDSRSGRLWQSRQWAGPAVGYIRTRQVVI